MCSIASVVEVYGVSSVQVLTLRSTVRISGIDGPCVIGTVEHETIGVFTKTVQVRLLRKMGLQIDILAFED